MIPVPASRACRLAQGAVVVVVVVGQGVAVRRSGERDRIVLRRILGSLGHGLSGLNRKVCFLLRLLVERRDRKDWLILGGLDHRLSSLSRWACFLLELVVSGRLLVGRLLCGLAVHVKAGVGGRGYLWLLGRLQCCRARTGGGGYLGRHLRWMDRKLLVVVGCCWLRGIVALGRLHH